MIDPGQVSAVLVTRGNQPLHEIYASIEDAGITDIVVWDNSQRSEDLACYGRYAGIAEAKNQFIYTQDDDLVAPVGELLECWQTGDSCSILANNRIDEEWPLVGMGSLFDRCLVDGTFDAYTDAHGLDEEFRKHLCDVVFAYQHPYRRVLLGYRNLPWAADPHASLYLEPGQHSMRLRGRERLFEVLRAT